MPFESPDEPLGDLLQDVAIGKIRLPDFQPEWRWDTDRTASLITNVAQGYPVGIVMTLEVGGEGVSGVPGRAVMKMPVPREGDLLWHASSPRRWDGVQ